MNIKPISKETEKLADSVKPTLRSISAVDSSKKPLDDHHNPAGPQAEPKSYRVDESPRRVVISLIDRESGTIIQQLSPSEAVRYAHHLNEAVRNMINEVA